MDDRPPLPPPLPPPPPPPIDLGPGPFYGPGFQQDHEILPPPHDWSGDQYQPERPPEPPELERKNSLAPSILVIVAALLVIVIFVAPWYTLYLNGTSSSGVTINGYEDLNTFSVCANATGTSSTGAFSSSGGCTYYLQGGALGIILLIPAILFGLSLVFGIISGVLGIKAASAKGQVFSKSMKRPYSLSRLALVFLIIGFLVFFGLFTFAMGGISHDFCNPGTGGSGLGGSCPYTLNSDGTPVNGNMTWGPGIATFVAILSIVVLFIGTLRLRSYYREMRYWDPSDPVNQAPAPT